MKSVISRFRFSLSHLFVVTIVISLLYALYTYSPRLFGMTMLAVIAANVLGLAVGLLVTHVLKIPNDGSNAYDEDE